MDSLYTKNGLRPVSTSSVLTFFLACEADGELFFNPLYQREYVWSDTEAQQLLKQIFDNKPIGSLAVCLNENGAPEHYCEVVDGRQRLTTLIRFVKGEFPYRLPDGTEIFFADMSKLDQMEFKKTKLPHYNLSTGTSEAVTDRQKIEYFFSVNFAGVPQSEQHKQHVKELLEQL
ncbi:DUF262 domain-containing protein [Vibrio anguillarum]|uniref:DUF262 domain-containing protein n=1 Tax=Vibrio anguillarum TaxID=55601 RepID=UPI001889CE9C|nr:DUF262 domain-containing protein [Vibrio anguillarum]MBF4252771.1 DUF262 domain-containing protein [Vibrio anguillarum]